MMSERKRKHASSHRKKTWDQRSRDDDAAIIAKADKRVLELAGSVGSDPSELHEVSFWIYFSDEDQAYKAASELNKQKFNVEVSPPLEGHRKWLCLAYMQLLPKFSVIDRYRKLLTAVATRFGGEFDGWEMEVKM